MNANSNQPVLMTTTSAMRPTYANTCLNAGIFIDHGS